MKSFLYIVPMVAALAGCQATQTDQTVGGAAAGAAIGAAVAGDGDRVEGALIGGTLGAAAGAYLGRAQNRPGQCIYQYPNGQRYYDTCPS
ncbi:glycine zipper 2TM domain-containing protein [Oceaniglobus roseus]|uniref:glycine zipper 2TM domain-containing protein n=1 Tax=Oceaniglobus roseus TaxID=1737570 RepID=UPI000C7E9459|nr:glycine zipper 2TM domain-containing protein [Kandeliimicrobium roseum]